MHIREMHLKGFKRFTDLKIADLPATAKLIILAGPNGNGKSSLFDAFVTYHHQQLSGHGYNWDKDYNQKKSDTSGLGQGDRIKIEFHEGLPSDDEGRKKAFYVRSAYRNEPEFKTNNLQQVRSALNHRRLNRLIDNDVTVSQNYTRIASLAVQELYGNSTRTFAQFRKETREDINSYLSRLLPHLALTDLGRPLENGTFFFSKGDSKNFSYMNLSGGEKAIFDVLLDILVNKNDFSNTVYAIDEPETHINPRLHSELLHVLYEVIPDSCQMWLATHAFGMLRAARDIANTNPDKVTFLDFDNDFDKSIVIKPVIFGRAFWERSLSTAFGDLASLIAPRTIIRCEGANGENPGDGFDSLVYETIFDKEFPDVRFVSSGSSNDLQKDITLITAAIEGRIPGLAFRKLFDRDDKSPNEIRDAKGKGDSVLRRRHIESYLFDDEVLSSLARSKGQEDKSSELIAAKNAALLSAKNRGRPEDDMKSASGEAYVAIKKILKLTQGGNNARAFMRDTLAPLIDRDMNVYKELKEDIFP